MLPVLRLGRRMAPRDRLLTLGLFAVLSVCAAPISWKHAYLVVFLPLAPLWAEALRERWSGWKLALLGLISAELGSFLFDSVAAKLIHGPTLGVLALLAPGTGVALVLWQLAAMRPHLQRAS